MVEGGWQDTRRQVHNPENRNGEVGTCYNVQASLLYSKILPGIPYSTLLIIGWTPQLYSQT